MSEFVHANSEKLYLLFFSLYLISVTVNTTTFYVYYPHRIAVLVQLMTVTVMLAKIGLFDQLTTKETIVEVGLLSLVTIVALISSAHYLLVTVLLMMGARNVSFRRIVKTYLIVVGSILLLALIASQLGWIKDITFYTEDGIRRSFGVVYTTDFAAHIFYLGCAYLYLKARKFRLLDLVPVLLGLFVIYFYTRTMTDTIAMIVLLIGFLCYVYRRQLVHLTFIRVGLRYNFLALPIVSALIIGISTVFDYNDKILRLLNDFLSNRLVLGHNGLFAYGVKLFGQPWIPVNGWGGDRATTFTNGMGEVTYFFLDSSFLNMLISYGLLLTIIIVVGISGFLYKRTVENDYLLPVIMLAVAISSAFDQHFLEVTYNVFILACFANLPRYHTQVGPSFKQPVVRERLAEGGRQRE
ncbi:polysaccharide biosynthesis protein [Lactiplantibacillus garii]|uniref:polysaccharide biosynthesis protein n=1 Tax=Lactiplantibacillus garii TaxID=2306423 RepID=UPI001CDD8972|nr:polysaccharide biosynthesis protein [Lactiplantibacillus garii]